MISGGTDDPKDLGSKKMYNQEKESEKNEGFSGENLPKNYDPSSKHLDTEVDKDQDGNTEVSQRARDVDEKQSPAVNSTSSKTTDDNGQTVSKSRGTHDDKEDMETAENRDFNSDTDEDRNVSSDKEDKKSRGNINFGK